MLIDFTVQNFLSIRDEITLSFVNDKNKLPNTISISNENFSVYSCNVMYGPNASGKSNIVKGLNNFLQMVERSNAFQIDESIPFYKPFLLDEVSKNSPTTFEIEFIADGIRYSYAFSFNKNVIIEETLKFFPEGRPANLFNRIAGKPINFGTYLKGEKKSIEKLLSPNVLFLSRAANSSHPQLLPVYRYLRDAIVLHTNMDSRGVPFHSTTEFIDKKGDDFKKRVIRLLNAADLNINGITLEEDIRQANFLQFPEDMPDEVKEDIIKRFSTKPKIGHPIYSENGKIIDTEYFDLERSESGGTIKMYDLASEILLALDKGTVLVIDEFDSGLHPLITQFIVTLFQDLQINKNGAQLLVATHDPLLMDNLNLDREQIWFSDKSKEGVTDLYSLGDFEKTKLRKNSSFLNWYLNGRLRAVPATDLSSFYEEWADA